MTKTDARLDAIAAIRLVLAGETDMADAMIRSTQDPAELAAAACSFGAQLLTLAAPAQETRALILDQLTRAATAE